MLKNKLSQRLYENLKALYFDIKRFYRRLVSSKKKRHTKFTNLHIGCGDKKVEGWINVDLSGADVNIDLSAGYLPWNDNVFENIASQHFVEHLYIKDELIPMLKECYRVLKPNGQLWLSTPDLKKLCNAYLNDACAGMVTDRAARLSNWTLGNYPSQQFMNDMFYQKGEHKNLFDYELLKWVLQQAGFSNIEKSNETGFMKQFPDFFNRHDDLQTLYVKAIK